MVGMSTDVSILVMCRAGLEALSLLSRACSSPTKAQPRWRLEIGLGLAWDLWSLSRRFKPGLVFVEILSNNIYVFGKAVLIFPIAVWALIWHTLAELVRHVTATWPWSCVYCRTYCLYPPPQNHFVLSSLPARATWVWDIEVTLNDVTVHYRDLFEWSNQTTLNVHFHCHLGLFSLPRKGQHIDVHTSELVILEQGDSGE